MNELPNICLKDGCNNLTKKGKKHCELHKVDYHALQVKWGLFYADERKKKERSPFLKGEYKLPDQMCGDKKCYLKKDAVTAKRAREKDGAKKLRVYHCPRCNLWHLTHKAIR